MLLEIPTCPAVADQGQEAGKKYSLEYLITGFA